MKILTAILLIMVAMALCVLLFPLCVAFAVIYFALAREDSTGWYNWFYRIALGLDMLGNTVCGPLFNVVMIRAGGYCFGLDGETISSALGKNVVRGTLTWPGRLLNWLLCRIQANHAVLSIEEGVSNPDIRE
jgi:8-oxo-dGTP diphosphatase